MGNSRGSRDRYDAEILRDLRKEMSLKLKMLRTEQAQLVELLKSGFDNEVFRKFNVINYRIKVATIRHKGDWLHGDFPDIVTVNK